MAGIFVRDPYEASQRNFVKIDYSYNLYSAATAASPESGYFVCLCNLPSYILRDRKEAQALDAVLQSIRQRTGFRASTGPQPAGVVLTEPPLFNVEAVSLLEDSAGNLRTWSGSLTRGNRPGLLVDFTLLESRQQLLAVLNHLATSNHIEETLRDPPQLANSDWSWIGLIAIVLGVHVQGSFALSPGRKATFMVMIGDI